MPWSRFPAAKLRPVNVYSATAGPGRQDITSSTWVAVSGLSITLTPTNNSSKFFLMANVNHSSTYVTSFTFFRGGANLFSHANTNETGAHSTIFWGQSDPNSYVMQTNMNWVDSPATASPVTYDVCGTSSWSGGTNTLRINDRSSDMASLSSLVVVEFLS